MKPTEYKLVDVRGARFGHNGLEWQRFIDELQAHVRLGHEVEIAITQYGSAQVQQLVQPESRP